MRYHYKKPPLYVNHEPVKVNHWLYSEATLYGFEGYGLFVIQQRFDSVSKKSYWGAIDPWLVDDISEQRHFKAIFWRLAQKPGADGLCPTVTVRHLMNLLGMKPMKKEPWETYFDRELI